jgi:hypothetical protein
VAVRRLRHKAWREQVALPPGDCKPASVWVKADRLHPLLPRETPRFRKLYKGRGAVEREFAGSRTNGRSRRPRAWA